MESIAKLSKKYQFSVIEDASHAIGGWYNNVPVGSCLYSDITVFSFHPVKIITTAEGGWLQMLANKCQNCMVSQRSPKPGPWVGNKILAQYQ